MQEALHPKNMGEIKNPGGVGKVGNPLCGDILWIYIKVSKNKKGVEILKDIKFKTFGCFAAIASSSMITQAVKGKTLKEAKKLKIKDILKKLKGLPAMKTHCSGMAIEALGKAIADYENKKGIKTF